MNPLLCLREQMYIIIKWLYITGLANLERPTQQVVQTVIALFQKGKEVAMQMIKSEYSIYCVIK
jgi:hypothetical protein